MTVRNRGPARSTRVSLDAVVYGGDVRWVTTFRGTRCRVRGKVVQHIHCDIRNLARGRMATVLVLVRTARTAEPLVTAASVRGVEPDPVGRNNDDVEVTRVRR